ncbi:hypothetical protein O206_20720 [Ochrobactrum sp. EGD-AQ16]|nr:hypothetical protein O206_20720 [Ochrobactrum sp. EGD-AQ16]
MKRFLTTCAGVLLLTGCTSTNLGSNQPAFSLNAKRIAECERKDFPTHRAKADCMNAADRALMPAVGSDADLLRYRMAKRIEVAQRIDSGKISVAKANSEILRVYADVQSERNKRVAIRAQTAANIMQAQNQSNAMTSMANSQARMANTLENAELRRSRVNGQPDPFSWARTYSQQW